MINSDTVIINDFYKTQLKKEKENLRKYRHLNWDHNHPSIMESKVLIEYLEKKVMEGF